MKVAFRVDASLQIGTGHVMRCLTLADALAAQGADCLFICREHQGNLIEQIRNKGYRVHGLPTLDSVGASLLAIKTTSDEISPAHSHWLGSTQVEDAAACTAILAEVNYDWLIVDHYALDTRWELTLKPYYRKLMVIDDLADRPHLCDLLLDQNWFGDDTLKRYYERVPTHCKCYLGPEYALLKPEYVQLRASMSPRDGAVRRVLVFLGGSDPTNQTGKVLTALMLPSLEQLYVDVVIGQNHPDAKGIIAQVAAHSRITLHQGLPTLAPLMAYADLMIGAGGSTTWERMCLGLPSIVISIAANQTNTNVALMKAGFIDFLGAMSDVSVLNIADAIQRSLANPETLRVQSVLGQYLVPGTGSLVLGEQILSNDGV